MKWFGEEWGSPVNRECERAPVPIGQKCLVCSELIQENDPGLLIPAHRAAPAVGDTVSFVSAYAPVLLHGVVANMPIPNEKHERYEVKFGEGENEERWAIPKRELIVRDAYEPVHLDCFLGQLMGAMQ